MKIFKDATSQKRLFWVSIVLLIVFAVIGQIGIDRICLASERGQYWGYESCLPYLGRTIAATCASIGLSFLAVRFFPVRKKPMLVIAWILGIAIAAWATFLSVRFFCMAQESKDIYGAAGLWLASVDRLDEERTVWNKSRWFGHGYAVYETDYGTFTEAESRLSLGNEDEEPYHTIVDERYKMESVFQYCEADTMINVLSYFYGKWVWLVYSLLMLCAAIFALSLFPANAGVPGKLLFLVMWVLFAITVLLPALNGCALVIDPIAGPPFTGVESVYWQYGVLVAGPPIGIIAGLTDREKGK